ncbi:MAG TPA: hypothetical protein ENN76_02345, partial [Euryarchaeota archaeon]|nr:hypothetical protein [Euryarchaeota archaeon]
MAEIGPVMAIPSYFIWSLKKILQESGADPKDILFKVGFDTGKNVGDSGETVLSPDTFTDFLFNHLMESGLGRPKITRYGASFNINMEESSESLNRKPPQGCHYTAGYISGIATSLLNREYKARETECISKHSAVCVFDLA